MFTAYVKTISGAVYSSSTKLEEFNGVKDRFLSGFVKKHWPRWLLPNYLTIARIAIGFSLFILLFDFRNDSGVFISSLFALGVLTDILDGVVARSLHKKTIFGTYADPLADRILILPVLVYVLMEYQFLLFFIVFFEIINAFVSMVGQDKELFLEANIFGKTKMAAESAALLVILLFWPKDPNPFLLSVLWMTVGLMLINITAKIDQLAIYYVKQKHKNIQHAIPEKRAL